MGYITKSDTKDVIKAICNASMTYLSGTHDEGEYEVFDDQRLVNAILSVNKALQRGIDDMPAADVVERKTGQWLEENVSEDKVIDMWQSAKRSVCGKYHTTPYLYNFNRYNFCPHCGAQMTERG